MAGGSQILIDDQGITISTGGKIVYQAGQHKFEGGRRVKAEIPPLPIVNEIKTFTNKWDFYDLFYQSDFSDIKYKLINKERRFLSNYWSKRWRKIYFIKINFRLTYSSKWKNTKENQK